MVLLRGPFVRGNALDPLADPGDRLGHAVPPDGQEGQVDVLPVPKRPARTGDLGQDDRQFGVGLAAVRRASGLMVRERSLVVVH
jgi:hypothetical protein